MKINKIYINAFGGLKDITLDLSDGLNVVFGENEQGKTTVLEFIKAMFYGTGKKTQNIGSSARIKYAPMDGSQAAGRIFFEMNGKNYRLERIFLKSDATDKITLTDTDTGETATVTNEIGNKIFGIGAEAFKKSMFVSAERNYEADDVANGDLNARLSAVALTGSSDTSYQKIEKRITSAKEKILSKTERAGKLATLRKEREELSAAYENASADAQKRNELREKIDETDKETAEISKKLRIVKQLLDKKDETKNAGKLKKYLSLKAELDELSAELVTPGKTAIDTNFISKIRFCKAKADPQSEQVRRLQGELEELLNAEKMSESMDPGTAEAKRSAIAGEIEKLENEKQNISDGLSSAERDLSKLEESEAAAQNAKKPINPVLLIIAVALIISGVAGGIFVNSLGYIAAGGGLIVALLAFVIKPANKNAVLKIKTEIADIKTKIATLKNEEAGITAKIASKAGEMTTLAAIISADKTVRENRLAEIETKKAQLDEAVKKENALLEEYEKALDGLEPDEEKISAILEKAEKQKQLKLNLSYLANDLGGISYEQAQERLSRINEGEDYSEIDFEKVEREYENLSQKLLELSSRKTGYETELKTAFKNSLQPEVVLREIKIIDEKIAVLEEFVSSCEVCLAVLEESFSGIRKGYGSELEEKTLKNFTALTNGKYKSVSVNKSLQMQVERSDAFGMFDTGYLSTGTEDQAFLALRLAICDMIGDKEGYPVFLDDALSNYDDARTETALKFLKAFAEKSQVLLFTCHGKISEISEQIGASVKPLK